MKRHVFLLFLWFLLRTAAGAANLSAGEWFIDNDPGRGAGTAFALPEASSANISVTIPPAALHGLAAGYHLLGVRLLDDTGEWGHVTWRGFHKDVAGEAPRQLTGAEWFIDTDPGIGMATPIAVPPSETSNLVPEIPASILNQLAPGYHLLGVRLRDDALRWGHVTWRGFHIGETPVPAPAIASVQYRIVRSGSVVAESTANASPTGTSVIIAVNHGNPDLLMDAAHLIEAVPIDASGRRGHATYAEFVYRATAGSELAVALDTPGRDYFPGGSGHWFAQAITTHDGVDAAQSGAIGHGEQTWFETTVTGPGSLSFWWKVSSEANWDHLEFSIDGVLQSGRISGSTDWARKDYEISAGPHLLRWRYIKDGGVAHGSDAGWVDQISWLPAGSFAASAAAAGLTGNEALPTATPFKDGVENLLKYAFNMNLAGPDTSKLPPGTGTSGLPLITTPEDAPPGTLRFEFLRRKGSGLVYAPQKSTTLDGTGWAPVAAAPVVTSIDDQWERVVYTEAPDPVPAPACFGRVVVVIP